MEHNLYSEVEKKQTNIMTLKLENTNMKIEVARLKERNYAAKGMLLLLPIIVVI